MPKSADDYERMSDERLAARAAACDESAIRLIAKRHSQRLFRAAWSVLRNTSEAEDVLQEAYVKVIPSLGNYTGQASLGTWLTRIVLNAAIDRRREMTRDDAKLRDGHGALLDYYRDRQSVSAGGAPESELVRAEIARALEVAIASLPDEFRTVFVLRAIEGMSVRDVALALSVKEATVKTRMHRARRLLQKFLGPEFKRILSDVLVFAGPKCDALTQRVLRALSIT